MENQSEHHDLLAYIQPERGTEIAEVQLAAHAADILQAGADTSNTTLCTAIYCYNCTNHRHIAHTNNFNWSTTVNKQESQKLPMRVLCVR